MPPARKAPTVQPTLNVERIKQHAGQKQVERAVQVNVPGKHFPQL